MAGQAGPVTLNRPVVGGIAVGGSGGSLCGTASFGGTWDCQVIGKVGVSGGTWGCERGTPPGEGSLVDRVVSAIAHGET